MVEINVRYVSRFEFGFKLAALIHAGLPKNRPARRSPPPAPAAPRLSRAPGITAAAPPSISSSCIHAAAVPLPPAASRWPCCCVQLFG